MKKVMSTIVLLFTLLLTACHGRVEMNNYEVPTEFDTSKKHEITFWAKNDTNVAQTNVYKKAISDFQKLYPNITVNLRLYTDYGRIYNDVITNISTNTTPNICITYPDHIATYMTGSNIVVPLDEFMQDSKFGLAGSEVLFDSPSKDELIEKYINECKFNDRYYALPFMRSSEACYINKDLVEKLGYSIPDVLTWDFVWEVSEKAMEKDSSGNFKINGQNVLIPFIYKSTDNMLISMLNQRDAGYSDASGNILIFNDDTREILKTIASHAKTGAFSTFAISSYPANFLNAGQCIFAIDSTAGSTWMGANAPLSDISEDAFVDFETVVKIIPQYDTSRPMMISQGPSVCIFNKEDPQEVLASWLFTQYLLTNEVQISYSKTEGYAPVTSKAINDQTYVNYLGNAGKDNKEHYDIKIEATRLVIDNSLNSFVTPVFNGSASLRSAAGQMIENVTKAERRRKNVDDAFIDKTFSDVTSLYRLDQNNSGTNGKADLGPLPDTAIILLVSLAVIWLIILTYLFFDKYKNKQ